MSNGHRSILIEQQLGNGKPHDRTAADHNGFASGQLHARILQELHDTLRRTGQHAGLFLPESRHIEGVEAIHILLLTNPCDHLIRIDMFRQRQLDQNSVHRIVGIEVVDNFQQLLLRNVRRLANLKSPAGTVIQTGDFKIDTTPIDGGVIDIARLSQLGTEGVLALLSDSTNAAKPGFTESERKVGETFETQFRKANGRRLIVATFASNIHRVQQIIDVAESLGRKVALSGRSLENVVSIAAEMGYIRIPDGILIGIDSINRYPADKLVIITTGSQGEPMSALYRMAFSEHRRVAICPNDYVIISATPIPGNEKMVGKVVDELLKQGAEVVYEKMYDVHVSGHACQEELKIMMSITKPKYFIPVHGEQKHLRKNAGLAKSVGIPPQNILIADNGKEVELTEDKIRISGDVPAGMVFVDGSGVGDVGSVVLRDRKRLAEDGLIIIVATIDKETGDVLSGPEVISRGFVYVRESEQLIDKARRLCDSVIADCMFERVHDWTTVKNRLRDEVSHLMYHETKRSPMILPVIMEI